MRDGIKQITEGWSEDKNHIIYTITLDDDYVIEGRGYTNEAARDAAMEQADCVLQYRKWVAAMADLRDPAPSEGPAADEPADTPQPCQAPVVPRGMIVYYYEILGGTHSAGMFAIVADVNPDRSLTLAVLAPNGTWHQRGGVPLLGAPPAEDIAGYAMRV